MYKKDSLKFRCTVARYAIIHCARPTTTKYKLTVLTVRTFIKSFKDAQFKNPNTDLEIVPKRKRGRLTLLTKETDHKVMVMVKKMQESGAVIDYSIIIAVLAGLIMTNDKTLLKDNGGTIKLRKKWCKLISKRLCYVKRKVTTAKPVIAPGIILEIGLTFYDKTNEIVQAMRFQLKWLSTSIKHRYLLSVSATTHC